MPSQRHPSTLTYKACTLLVAFVIGCGSSSDDTRPPVRGTNPAANNNSATTNTGSGGSGTDTFGNSPVPMGGAGNPASMMPATMTPAMTTCAQGDASTSPVTPTVWLVLDGSGSMNEDFGGQGQSRWEALRAALMDPGGVVETLQHTVRFGMVLYSGNQDDAIAGGAECYQMVTVQPALDNFQMLSAQYPAMELGGWTPTDRALQNVVDTLPVTNSQVALDAKPDPIYVILATDGAPNDHCTDGAMTRGTGSSQFDAMTAQRVLDVVGKGVMMGMQMFVISLAGDDMQLAMHLQQVADLGGTGQPPFTPSNKDDLVSVLQKIIGNATCQVRLNGKVIAGKECSGEVSLNGNALACDQADGWMLADESTVQLTGTACDSFLQMQSLVHATFPCDAFSPD